MRETVELSSLDLRYEGHRLRDDAREARLLASIAERGIEEPLQGVDRSVARFLLDGFKRCRSAKKLGIDCVPYVSLGAEEATGILNLMRASTGKGLNILEQARFVVDLVSIHGMSVAEVAQTLSRQVTPAVFAEALTRARRYRVVQMETLQRIAWLCMSQGQEPLPDVDVDEGFRQRPAYQEGFLTDEPDLSVYDETSPEDRTTDEPESEDHDG